MGIGPKTGGRCLGYQADPHHLFQVGPAFVAVRVAGHLWPSIYRVDIQACSRGRAACGRRARSYCTRPAVPHPADVWSLHPQRTSDKRNTIFASSLRRASSRTAMDHDQQIAKQSTSDSSYNDHYVLLTEQPSHAHREQRVVACSSFLSLRTFTAFRVCERGVGGRASRPSNPPPPGPSLRSWRFCG